MASGALAQSARAPRVYRGTHSLRLMRQHTTPPEPVRAPEFPAGLDWINTGGAPLVMAELRDRIVLLDFWTYG